MRFVLPSVLLLGGVCLTAAAAQADGVRFALVPKKHDQQFFQQIRKGCMEEAAKSAKITCVYRGPTRADFRLQDQVISDLIDEGVDGIAVAVINSVYLSKNSLKKARQKGIPVITVDSEMMHTPRLNPDMYRRAYVGTDNLEMGRVIARQLKAYGVGGAYAVITGNPTDYNLNQRLAGVYEVLQDQAWKEYSRSPFYAKDDPRHSLRVLDFLHTIHVKTPNRLQAVLSLTAAMQSPTNAYRKQVEGYTDRHSAVHFFIASADASAHQLKHLNDGLIDVHVGQSPKAMGRMSMRILDRIHKGLPVKKAYYTPLRICKGNRTPVCQPVK